MNEETVIICPYCDSEKSGEEIGCCGESRAHFQRISRAEFEGDFPEDAA